MTMRGIALAMAALLTGCASGGSPSDGRMNAQPGPSVSQIQTAALQSGQKQPDAALSQKDTSDEQPSGSTLMRQRLYAVFQSSQVAAKAALENHLFDEAITQAQQQLEMIDKNPGLFSKLETQSMRDATQAQLDLAQSQKEQWKREGLQPVDPRAVAREALRQRVRAMLTDARSLYDQGNYDATEALLEVAVQADPTNRDVALMLRLVNDKIADRTYGDLSQKLELPMPLAPPTGSSRKNGL